VPLKDVISCLNITLWVQFLREIYPFKKTTPKYNAASGTIAGILLVRKHVRLKEVVLCLNRSILGQFLREICPFKKGPLCTCLCSVFLTYEIFTSSTKIIITACFLHTLEHPRFKKNRKSAKIRIPQRARDSFSNGYISPRIE
jgi:hypothetical protein